MVGIMNKIFAQINQISLKSINCIDLGQGGA